VSLSIERAIEPAHAAVYLRGMRLPCERVTRYELGERVSTQADLDALAAFDGHLHASSELIYDGQFERARTELEWAIALRPDDSAPYWLMARLIFLELEHRAPELDRHDRIEAYERAESWADAAVERAPERAEGYLWQGIARGRIATTRGNVRIALVGVVGGRGPAWLEQTLRKATSLPDEYRLFGFTTRGDALYALAQYYRLAPDGWYMRLIGTSGDRDGAVELARDAVEIQPVRIEYRKELAVALLCRGARGDARAAADQLRALLALPATTEIDRVDREHARMLLAEPPANVCWYSRDGFLEPAS
jgi:tetratricopeptide (TPR) repeat protein